MGLEYSWLTTILGVLPFILLMAGFLLYLAIQRWKRLTNANLGKIRSMLRDFHGKIENFRLVSAGFSADDPDEYGKFAEQYLTLLMRTDHDVKNLSRLYIDFAEALRENEKVSTLRRLVKFPTKAYQIYQESEEMLQKLEILSSKLGDLEAAKSKLLDFSWLVAQSSKLLLDKVRSSDETLKRLEENGAEGDLILSTIKQIHQWQDTLLAQTPVIFYSSDPDLVRMQASKEETIRVQKMNLVSSPEIETLYAVVSGWSKAKENRDYAAQEIKGLIVLCEKIIQQTNQSSVLSLKFSKSEQIFGEVQHALDQVFQTNEQFQVEKFDAQARILNEKLAAMQELHKRLTEVQVRYEQLVAVQFSDEVIKSQEILKDAYRKMGEVEKFHLGNYAAGDQVQNLRVDIDRAASLHRKFSRFAQADLVDETELDEKLSVVQDLFASIKGISLRLAGAYKRFLDLSGQISAFFAEILKTQNWIDELKVIAENKPLLRKDSLRQIEKLDQLIKQASSDLNDVKTDVFEKRVKRIQQVRTGFQDLLARFTDFLEKDERKRCADVSRQLETLKEMALFDDPILVEAERNLLPAIQPPAAARVEALLLEKMFQDFVSQNDLWTKKFTIFERFFEATNPILRIHQQAQKSRQAATKLMEQIEKIFPEDEEAWPPTSQRAGNRKVIFRNLESQWTKLRQERIKLDAFNHSVLTLGSQYDELKTELAGLVEVVLQEQGKFTDLERRLEESKRMWKTIARNYQTNRAIVDGVDGLIAGIEHEVNQLKQQYQQGRINSQFALQRFRAICRKTDEAVVDVDGRQLIDINGTLQNRL